MYVDTGGLQSDRIVPRAGYYRYFQALVEKPIGGGAVFVSGAGITGWPNR